MSMVSFRVYALLRVSVALTETVYDPVVTEEGTYHTYSQIVAEVFNDMAVLVTKPAIAIVGVACIFKSKVAVKVTIPEVITVSEFTKPWKDKFPSWDDSPLEKWIQRNQKALKKFLIHTIALNLD